jgi:hypothetical protein
MGFDRKFLVSALGFAVIGMCFGIFMSATHDFAQRPTHVHILLVGFVVSMLYAIIHKLWISPAALGLARIQFIVHHLGAVVMTTSLFLLFAQIVPEAQLVPFLAGSSITVLVGVLLMLFMVIKSK